jgi:peroxiredoxin
MILNAVEEKLLDQMRTNEGYSLLDLSYRQPVLLVFLRHFGCTFCREALDDIARKRQTLETAGTKLVFVHMATSEVATQYFGRFNLPGVEHISDPDSYFYKAFGLGKGTFTQLFGLRTWIRGFDAGVMRGHGLEYGAHLGDSFQMPGVFILQNGDIKESYIHKLASDRPDYEKLTRCCTI